jgi:hypothetical protein
VVPPISYSEAHGPWFDSPYGQFRPTPDGPLLKAQDQANHDALLARAIRSGQEAMRLGFGYDSGANVCPQCRACAPTALFNGRCKHRPGPAQLAQKHAWDRAADATMLRQQAAMHAGASSLAAVEDWRAPVERGRLGAEVLAALGL